VSALTQKRTINSGQASSSRVYTRFFLATLRDFFFVLAFLFGAVRFLTASLLASFFFAGAVGVAPLP
jgi:hypothetical protein